MTNFFYFSVAKLPADMTQDELEREIEAADHYTERCREIGQGVNSKEHVRRQRCAAQLEELNRGANSVS